MTDSINELKKLLEYQNSYSVIDMSHNNKPAYKVLLNDEDNYIKAIEWAVNNFGNFGEDNWWPAPFLAVDTNNNNKFKQKFEFVFKNPEYATQFKIMGF